MVRLPFPVIAPVKPSVVSRATSMPLDCDTVTTRFVSKLAVVASTPPLKVRPPDAAPRLASLDTDKVPNRTSVPPV
ncbi:hypothetical protein D3C71_1901930 [compost metagenome]